MPGSYSGEGNYEKIGENYQICDCLGIFVNNLYNLLGQKNTGRSNFFASHQIGFTPSPQKKLHLPPPITPPLNLI